MTQVPIIQHDPAFINGVIHSLTGAQILYYLFFSWESQPNRPVILWCQKGETAGKVNAIRVALAKERKARDLPRTFELRFSQHWPYTHEGIKGEAIKIERSSGGLRMQMRTAMLTLNNGVNRNG